MTVSIAEERRRRDALARSQLLVPPQEPALDFDDADAQSFANNNASYPSPWEVPEDPSLSPEESFMQNDPEMQQLAELAEEADTLEESQAIGRRMQGRLNAAKNEFANEATKIAKEKMSRWMAKGAGNGTNALGSFGWDGFVSFSVTYMYLLGRLFVNILMPESKGGDGSSSDIVKKGMRTLFPAYRLSEPGDIGYFLFSSVIALTLFTIVLAIIFLNVIVFAIPILIVMNLF